MRAVTDPTEEALTLLQSLAWADEKTRARLQDHGVDVQAITIYRSTPSIQEINESFEYGRPDPPYMNADVFDDDLLRRTTTRLAAETHDFIPQRSDDETSPGGFFWDNSQFSFCDAMAYWAFIRLIKPARVIEIGGGFSTLIALEAVRRNGKGRVHCFEPFPRPFLMKQKDLALYRERAQDITLARLGNVVKDGDILFIDSTHTVKTGSDCAHIYLRLLPFLQRQILVHAHDIFLPFGLPREWLTKHQIFWTEQYLLMALFLDNPRVKVLYGSAYAQHFFPELAARLMHGRYPSGGASIWFTYDGTRPHSTGKSWAEGRLRLSDRGK